jgi:ATP:ADP antiporter, AAA family
MKKTLLLSSICALICVNYYILRNLKDALIITEAGAEVIPFLKTWAILPSTIFLTMAFTWLANRMSLQRLFFSVISFFLIFFALFALVLYPFGDVLYLHGAAARLGYLFPEGWTGFISMIRYWPLSAFYIMAESWATIVWYILFWGFANEIISFDEAKKHYPAVILAGNLSAIVAGTAVNLLTFPSWTLTFNILTAVIIILGSAALYLFTFMTEDAPALLHVKEQEKMGFVDSLKYIKQSPYFICLTLVVLGFNLIINISEVVWKDQVLAIYPDPGAYNAYMSKISIAIGIASTLITLAFMRFELGKWGWTAIAVATPLVTFGSALFFFLPLLFSAAAGVLLLGSIHVVLSRSARYTLLDMSKEMAFIPFSSDEKLKAKTHIDGIGSRFGKSLGSGLFQGLLLFLPTISACIPLVFLILTAIVFSSLYSIAFIGRELKTSTQ